jgi:hypothetical protein
MLRWVPRDKRIREVKTYVVGIASGLVADPVAARCDVGIEHRIKRSHKCVLGTDKIMAE